MAAPALVIGRRTGAVPIGLHVPNAVGPLYQSVLSPFGDRYSTDELHHRVIVERGDERCAFGRPGAGAGNFSFPRGIGFVPGRQRGTSRLFVCDAWNDRVQVFDGHGLFVFAFGGRGSGPGLFNAPSGLAVVNPILPGDQEHPPVDREPMVAIADRENHRIQVFALDGTLVSSVGSGNGVTEPHASGSDLILRYPSKLVWEGPWLTVACAGEKVVAVDLAEAMSRTDNELPRARPRTRRAGLRLVASGGVRCAN